MSGDILQTPDAPKPQGALDNYFKITARGSTVRQEVLAGLTTFLAMVYSVIVVPGMLDFLIIGLGSHGLEFSLVALFL